MKKREVTGRLLTRGPPGLGASSGNLGCCRDSCREFCRDSWHNPLIPKRRTAARACRRADQLQNLPIVEHEASC